MTTFYVDTSSLAKRYVVETGSTWVTSWIEPVAGNVVIIAQLTAVEMFSLLSRRQREGTLSQPHVAALQTDFLYHAEKEYLQQLTGRLSHLYF